MIGVMDLSTDGPVEVEPTTDAFIQKANDEMARLVQRETELAVREAELRRERAALKPRIDALQKSIHMYREVMGLPGEGPTVADEAESGPDSTIADRAYQTMRSRGGRMRVADIAIELGVEYATAYSSLIRDARFLKGDPGEFVLGPSDGEVLKVVAEYQMRNPPPRFVRLGGLAEDRHWTLQLNSLIKRGLLIPYQVANPKTPEHPVTAVRVNTAAPEAQGMLGKAAKELDELDYDISDTA